MDPSVVNGAPACVVPPPPSSGDSGVGPCNGNPCIGDWQYEAAQGGAVVQCSDGTWSHAGGISGACSHHGGESSIQSPSTDNTTMPYTATMPGTSTAITPTTGTALPVQCWSNSSTGDFLSASSNNTCDFANNSFYEYFKASSGDPTQTRDVNIWSPQDQQYYSLSCTPNDTVVDCAGSNGGDIRFTQGAVTAYTSSQAAAYAASGKLGPNG